jgi:hypothetical protein
MSVLNHSLAVLLASGLRTALERLETWCQPELDWDGDLWALTSCVRDRDC